MPEIFWLVTNCPSHILHLTGFVKVVLRGHILSMEKLPLSSCKESNVVDGPISERSVDLFTVFINANCTCGKAFTQPFSFHSTWNHKH